ncbi:MAG: hypothetical protein EXR73_04140 [Myxococcales bacterium]|nr:hypothetical protein [Myxococcales bacterium]
MTAAGFNGPRARPAARLGPRCALLLSAAILAGAGACAEPESTLIFATISARATVRPATRLDITVANESSSRTATFPLAADTTFPQTFTLTPARSSGRLALSVRALDDAGFTVAQAVTAVEVVPDVRSELTLTLEPEDFVVNASPANLQWLTVLTGAAGRQLAEQPDGRFAVVWENSCPLDRCDVLGRLLGADTMPIVNGTSQDTGDFILNQSNTYTTGAFVAATASGWLVGWEAHNNMIPDSQAIAAPLRSDGAHGATFDSALSAGTFAASPMAAGLTGGGYATVWHDYPPVGDPPTSTGTAFVRLLDGEGNPVMSASGDDRPFPVDTNPGIQTFPVVAPLDAGGFAVAWLHRVPDGFDTNVRAQAFNAEGRPLEAVNTIVTSYFGGADAIGAMQIAPTVEGFALVWQASGDDALTTGPLFLRRYNAVGAALSSAIPIASHSDAYSPSPALAMRRSDGAIAVTWNDCEAGVPSPCDSDIWLRLFHASGLPVGERFVVNSTTAGNQEFPSIVAHVDGGFLVAWTDFSSTAPDTDGSAIRARVVYPSLERHDGVIGARCGGLTDLVCGDGLACVPHSGGDGATLCHEVCTDACVQGGSCDAGSCQFP